MDKRNKKQTKANYFKYKINDNGTVTISNVTYKLGTIKLIRLLLIIFAVLFLLLTPALPMLLIGSLFFGFVSRNYTKIINDAKEPVKTNNSVLINSSIETSESTIDSLFGSQANTVGKTTIQKKSNNLTFNVAGVTKKNDMNKDIAGLIKKIVKDIKDNADSSEFYEGMSNSEIKEELEGNPDYKIFELHYETIDDIKLIPEPSNPYDPNAIKVVSEEYGHLGYVPKDMTKKVKAKMEAGAFSVECTIVGGKFKYYDEDDDKVATDSWDYGLSIEIKS